MLLNKWRTKKKICKTSTRGCHVINNLSEATVGRGFLQEKITKQDIDSLIWPFLLVEGNTATVYLRLAD